MADVADVVVVGGGIGGASLATALAQAGVGVTVLEATTEFPDRVRGECLQAWGVKEARALGVEATLLDAGAHVSPIWKQYGEGVGGETILPMASMVPEISGTLNLRHPTACQALIEEAAKAGATVVRGVRDVKLTADPSPVVTYAIDGEMHEAEASLVVGADGRTSTVRKQTGI
jgi:2-polyprenyl-6-methoxyphenol hydroxylase-like FAD-dependent oxidoreductase